MTARGISIALAVFVAGAGLLSVEIAASRVLAPYFGNSIFVWGALIGVVLTGLAVGYWGGGALADRAPAPWLLVAAIAAGALAVLAIPLIDEAVLEAVVAWDPGPRLDPVVASILLFGAPSVLLAATTPIAVRLRARALATVGRTAGGLFSVSTVGSIVGTFVTAFWLIPELGTEQLLAVVAAALFAGAAVVAIAERLTLVALLTVGACVAAATASSFVAPDTGGTLSQAAARNWSPVYRLRDRPGPAEKLDPEGLEVVFRKDTRYHRLLVVDDTNTRYLRFGSSYQSAMDLSNPFSTVFGYTDFFALGLAYKPRARSMVFIGLGGGSAPKRMWRDFPWLRVHAVEIDPVVADVAHRYFAVPRDPRLGVTVEDGRRYLADHDRRWDLIALDTFFEDGLPFHLTTLESVRLVRERLTPGGVVLVNVIGSIRGQGSKLFRSIYRTYRSVFPTVLVHPVEGGPGEYQNMILVATDQPAATKGFLLARWRQIRQRHPSAPDLREAIRTRHDGSIPIDGVPTLTDDYAPTDALLTG